MSKAQQKEIGRLADQFRDSLTYMRKSADKGEYETVLQVTSMLAVGLGLLTGIARDLNRIADALEVSSAPRSGEDANRLGAP